MLRRPARLTRTPKPADGATDAPVVRVAGGGAAVAVAEPDDAPAAPVVTGAAPVTGVAPAESGLARLTARQTVVAQRLGAVPQPRAVPQAVPAVPSAQPAGLTRAGQTFLPGGTAATSSSGTTPGETLGLALGLLNRGGSGLEAELRRALPGGQLVLHYQVQRDLRTGALVSLEALIRWAHPEHGLLAPAAFLPLAQEAGFLGLIDTWALQRACQDGAWLATRGRAVEIAVNVTAAQLTDPRFVATVEDAMGRAGLAPGLLTLELGLRDVLSHVYAARDVALALRRRGVRVSVADVGSGATGPARLSALEVGEIKADRALIRALNDPSSGAATELAELVRVAHEHDARVVAEGVEDREQFNAAHAAGCDRVQGFLLGWPAPLEDLAHVLTGPVAQAG